MKQKTFVIQSDPKNLKTLRKELTGFLKKIHLPVKIQKEILIAIGEACTNSIRHSYRGDSRKKIRVTVKNLDEKIVFKIRDYGRKINLSKVKTPELPPQTPGGLGIHLMKTIMDELKYNTGHAEGNELILAKYKKRKKQGEDHEH